MNNHNKIVTATMLAAVETGGQVYGQARWDDYTAPMTNSDKEFTCTLGAYAFYGDEAEELIRMILKADPEIFRALDDGRIQGMLGVSWVDVRYWPDDSEIRALRALISTDAGIRCQKKLMSEIRLPKYIDRAVEFGVTDEAEQMMWCEIQHLGGLGPTKRVFERCKGNYSLESIMAALKQDQADARYSSNGVGSRKFWSRHEACVRMIREHAEAAPGSSAVYLQIGG